MQNPLVQQVVETLRGANNVLITVKNDPSVDELTAAIALTLILNHMNKHATTVFSGQVPSTIEFLQPEMAIESNTDSLRDFIIALDKSKADKLRYKVEDNVVRIFITPYRSSISEEDLEFSQGDFNVDVVVALGVVDKGNFDVAITSHGHILHDATVIAVTKDNMVDEVGAINWQDQQASSVSEMIASIADLFGTNVMDAQVATALMTGIVSETDRFKNNNTTPQVLAIGSTLLSAGANQQLIAEKLEQSQQNSSVQPLFSKTGNNVSPDGLLDVGHVGGDEVQKIDIDEHGNIASGPGPALNAAPKMDIPLDTPGGIDDNPDAGAAPSDADQQTRPIMNDRAYLAPPMNANADGKSPLAEPTGLFKGSGNDTVTDHNSDRVLQPPSPQDGKIEEDSGLLPPLAPAAGSPRGDSLIAGAMDETLISGGGTPPLPSTTFNPTPSSGAGQIGNGPAATGADANFDPSADPQTLEDIEEAVHSPHLGKKKDKAEINDYLGSVKELPKAPVELPQLPGLPLSGNGGSSEQANAAEASKYTPPVPSADKPDNASASILPPVDQPKVEDPTAAPEVPPPLVPMPQAPTNQPQFFESDGKKSNPFTK